MSIDELFADRCKKPQQFPDIWEHLPRLKELAGTFGHITEFGVRTGNSTTAFLAALARNGGRLISYDVNEPDFTAPSVPGVEWYFHKRNTADYSLAIEPTDLLFIDSCHDKAHVEKELRHAVRARHMVIMHDTSLNWKNSHGPLRAMLDFLVAGNGWTLREHFDNCNGLSVLVRS